jgi:CubicO group peptidase (beta-lactamase class C family)
VTDPVPVTVDTLFYAASVAKIVTATAVLQLVERGRLQLDLPMSHYLTSVVPADPRIDLVTIRHLLTHTSGLPDVEDYQWDAPEFDDGALKRFVQSQLGRPLLGNPGEQFAYSNLGYSVLGAIVAEVAQETFEKYVHSNVLEPLGMRQSTFNCPELSDPHTALPHDGLEAAALMPVYPYHRAHGPSSNFHTTARELGLWLTAHLAQGAPTAPRVLLPTTYRHMWQPARALDAQRAIGLGWFLVSLNGINWVGHGGHDPGFRAFCLIAPEAQLGVAALTNDDAVDMDNLAIDVIRNTASELSHIQAVNVRS